VSRAPDRRRILCTSCDLPFEIAAEAKSVNCPHCHTRVITEAIDVDGYVAVRRFTTANRLHVRKKGRVYAALRAESLEIDGFLQGEAVALHGIRIGRTAVIGGNLRATSLALDPGATLVGHVTIGPDAVPELQNLWSEAASEPTA
jgi:cytoskeletal protein CcmA (bactofilin family)